MFIAYRNLFGYIIGLAVVCSDNLRCGGIECRTVRADECNISCVVLDADINNELFRILCLDVKVAVLRPIGNRTDFVIVQYLVGLVVKYRLNARSVIICSQLNIDIVVE